MSLSPIENQDHLVEPTNDLEVVDPDEYATRGRTTLYARWGETYISTNRNLPPITPEGVTMTREEADEVLAERWGRSIVYEKK